MSATKNRKGRRKMIQLWVAQRPDVGFCEGIGDGPNHFSHMRSALLKRKARSEKQKAKPYHDLMRFPGDMTLLKCLKDVCLDKYASNARVPYEWRQPWIDPADCPVPNFDYRPDRKKLFDRIRVCLEKPLLDVPRKIAEAAIFHAVGRRWMWETG